MNTMTDIYFAVVEILDNISGQHTLVSKDNIRIISRHVDLKLAAMTMSFEYAENPANMTIIVIEGENIRGMSETEDELVRKTIAKDDRIP